MLADVDLFFHCSSCLLWVSKEKFFFVCVVGIISCYGENMERISLKVLHPGPKKDIWIATGHLMSVCLCVFYTPVHMCANVCVCIHTIVRNSVHMC